MVHREDDTIVVQMCHTKAVLGHYGSFMHHYVSLILQGLTCGDLGIILFRVGIEAPKVPITPAAITDSLTRVIII